MIAKDFYERIEYLIKTSQKGFTKASGCSIQIGSICTILLPSKGGDLRSGYDKETLSIINLLSELDELSDDFFEKPFFYPFSENQLNQLKKQCRVKDHSGKGYELEQKIIKLYEKILVKQQDIVADVSANLENNFLDTLSARSFILKEAISKIRDQITKLDEITESPWFFENASSAQDKRSLLRTLEYNLQGVCDDYNKKIKSEFNPELNLCEYLEATEKLILEAFDETKITFLNKIQDHSNYFIKFLDVLLRAITFGFAHISTPTESVIIEASSPINNRF